MFERILHHMQRRPRCAKKTEKIFPQRLVVFNEDEKGIKTNRKRLLKPLLKENPNGKAKAAHGVHVNSGGGATPANTDLLYVLVKAKCQSVLIGLFDDSKLANYPHGLGLNATFS